jgi:metal-sulfur cluster biosynthetic enzyme
MAACESELVAEIHRQLNSIGDPCSVAHGVPMGLDDMGLVQDVQVDPDGNVDIRLRLTSPTCVMVSYFKVQAEDLIAALPAVRSVRVTTDLGLDWTPDMMSEAAKQRRRAALMARGIAVQI